VRAGWLGGALVAMVLSAGVCYVTVPPIWAAILIGVGLGFIGTTIGMRLGQRFRAVTPEKRAEHAVDNADCAMQLRLSDEDRETWEANVVQEIRAAVEEERLACAIVADAHHASHEDVCSHKGAGRQIAVAIRARGQQ
jgi:hypothetical protein